jgi:glycosyltransferase involved in cell wall biosynthesis
MRILLVNSHGADAAVGGAETYVAALARGLRARDHDVRILAAFPARQPASDDAAAPTTVLHSSDWRDDRIRLYRNRAGDMTAWPTPRLRRLLAEIAADVVHTNNLPGITTAVWETARRQRTPVVHTLHDYYLLCPRMTLFGTPERPCCGHPTLCGARRSRLHRWSTGVSDVVGVSRYIVDQHLDAFPTARRHVIRHPALPGAVPAPAVPAGLKSIGYLGSLDEIKGIGVLLDAAPELRDRGYAIHIAGNGRLRPQVEQSARAGLVEYHGSVGGAEKTAFLERSDVGIVPSLWPEPGGPPYVVLEWLAARRPVLVSDRGGLAESAAAFPGAVTFEPTRQGMVSALEGLSTAEAWQAAVERIGAVGSPDELDRWLGEHEDVYRTATGGGDP